MGYFQVSYDSRVVIYECKMFIRLATGHLAREREPTQLTRESDWNRNKWLISCISESSIAKKIAKIFLFTTGPFSVERGLMEDKWMKLSVHKFDVDIRLSFSWTFFPL